MSDTLLVHRIMETLGLAVFQVKVNGITTHVIRVEPLLSLLIRLELSKIFLRGKDIQHRAVGHYQNEARNNSLDQP